MSEAADKSKQELLRDLLRQVSRSFYLSLRWLPVEVRNPISLAYLLARTSDTIADTDWIPADQRLAALDAFVSRISGTRSALLELEGLANGQGNPAEGILLKRAEDTLALLATLSESDRELVRRVLTTIISGQALDLKRFVHASASHIVALQTVGELEDYTFRVAGCVGEFWTGVCFRNLSPQPKLSESVMVLWGTRYGQGLQLVNILRDLPRDLRQGRCYLPIEQLEKVHLTPGDLLDPEHEAKLRPIYNSWLDEAESHLASGWQYTNAYPATHARIRISCVLPILIGQRTIDLLRTGHVLDPQVRIRTSRWEVRRLVFSAIASHPFEFLWRRLAP